MKLTKPQTFLPGKIFSALKKLSLSGPRPVIYIAGGWLRDYFLKKTSLDLDLVIFNYPAEKFSRKLSQMLKAHLVKLDDFNQTYRLILPEKNELRQIDINQPKGKDIAEDLKQRDFTINALALKLFPGEVKLIDLNNSRNDIAQGIIRLVSPQGFAADPLRMLRAFRFMAQLNFRLAEETYKKIKRYAPTIQKTAGERIAEEMFRILICPHSAIIVELIYECGLLEKIIPEISSMKKSGRQYYFHPRGLWQHTYQTLESLEYFLRKRQKIGFAEEISPDQIFALKLAALLHDSGKPRTKKIVANRVRFWEHEKYGEKLAGQTLQSLHLNRQIIRLTQKLIRYHMRPINLSNAQKITARAAWRLYADTGPAFPLLLLLALADCYSYRTLATFQPKQFRKQLAVIRLLLTYYKKFTAPSQPKLLDGHQVMKEFNLSPGPIVGKILRAVAEAQATKKIHTTEEAINYIRKKFKNNLL